MTNETTKTTTNAGRHRAMSEIEVKACRAIAPWQVRYPRACADKRMAGELATAANRPTPMITEDQATRLWDLVRRYRGQVFNEAVIAEAQRQ